MREVQSLPLSTMISFDIRGPGALDFCLSDPTLLIDLCDLVEVPKPSLVVVNGVAQSGVRMVCCLAWVDPASNQPVVRDARVVYLQDELKSRHITIK